MYLVYDTTTKTKERREVVVDFPAERFDSSDFIKHKLAIDKTLKENIMPQRLKDEELFELIDILNQVEENQLGQSDIVDMLAMASTKKLRNAAKLFKINIKIGKSIVETLREIKVPKYIIESLESAQKGGKLSNTYVNLMDILKLSMDTAAKISKILRYPKFVLSFLLAYFFAIIYYIIPATKQLINMMDTTEFPDISKKLYDMSAYSEDHQVLFVIYTLMATFAGYKALYWIFSKIIKMIPPIRRIGEYKDISLFFSILTSLSESGLMKLNAIIFASEVVGDIQLKEKLLKIGKKLQKEGGNFSEEAESLGFEKQVMSYLFYGEKTGKHNDYYRRIKNSYSKKMNLQIDIALEFINPLTMLFTVGIMLGLYIGVNAPLFTIGDIK